MHAVTKLLRCVKLNLNQRIKFVQIQKLANQSIFKQY